MSRTDKDAPWWVRAEWYEPCHHYCGFSNEPDSWQILVPQECNLPPEPIYRHPRQNHYRYGRYGRLTGCHWTAIWPVMWHLYDRPPGRMMRHLEWVGPDRARVRDALVLARQEYNGSGEVDVLEPVIDHRHASIKGWWW